MRGIVLAGGTGGRRQSLAHPISHPLMPVFDKPMIYYPLSTLMLAGVRDVLVLSGPDDVGAIRHLLGDGSDLGMTIEHRVQARPDGVPQAFTLGADFVGDDTVVLALGDNIVHGPAVGPAVAAHRDVVGAHVFAHRVHNPQDYGVVEFDAEGRVLSIEEKPRRPRSDFAVPGLYVYDNDVVEIARSIRPDARGRTDITAVNEVYRRLGRLEVTVLGPETAWIDTGSFDSLSTATEFVRSVEMRRGYKIGCIEEVAWRQGWIGDEQLLALGHRTRRTGYGEYLSLLAGHRRDRPVLELPAPRTRAAHAR